MRKDPAAAGHDGVVNQVGEPAGEDRRRRLEAVVTEVGVPLHRYLVRRADPGTADDVMGDVLLVLWRRLDDIPPEAALPWCYAVARRCLANHVRGAQRQRRLLGRLVRARPDQPVAADDLDGPDELHAALAALPATDAEVLRLWAWEDLAPGEIAVVLGVTPNAVSIRLHRAKQRLREGLAAQEAARKGAGSSGHLQQRQGRKAPRDR